MFFGKTFQEKQIESKGRGYDDATAKLAARVAALESWAKDVLPEMRHSHDRGDGHFSTSQVVLGERLIGKR